MKTFRSWKRAASALQARLVSGKVELLTVDVFDTLVLRRTSSALVLASSGRRLARITGADQTTCRMARDRAWRMCTATAISNGRDEDATSSDVHSTCVRLVAGDRLDETEIAALAGQIAAMEVEDEIDSLRPNPWMRAVLDTAVQAGVPVVAMSDMYLSSDEIRKILDAHGMSAGIDRIVASGTIGLQKRTGRLYGEMISDRGNANGWLHVGDDVIADGHMADKSGIESVVVRDSRESTFHSRNRVAATVGPESAMALVDAAISARPAFDDAAAEVGRVSFGPIYASFIHGVMQSSVRDGLDSVWYMAREGAILREIHELARSAGVVPDAPPCGYLLVSRLSSLRAAMKGFGEREIAAVVANTPAMSARKFLAPLLVDADTLSAVASRHDLDLDATFDAWGHTARQLLSDPSVVTAIARTEDDRKGFLAYLRRIGLMGSRRVGVVDVGWGGQIQENVEAAISGVEGAPEVFGYYLGTNDSAERRRQAGLRMEAVIVDSMSLDRAGHGAFEFVQGIELVVRASHASTVGYDASGPILGEGTPGRVKEENDDATIARIQVGIRAFCEDFMPLLAMSGLGSTETAAMARVSCDVMSLTPGRPLARTIVEFDNVANLGMDEGLLMGHRISPLQPHKVLAAMKGTLWQEGTAAAAYGSPGALLLLARKSIRRRAREVATRVQVAASSPASPDIIDLPLEAAEFADKSWAKSLELAGRIPLSENYSAGAFGFRTAFMAEAISILRDKKLSGHLSGWLKSARASSLVKLRRSLWAEPLKIFTRKYRRFL